MKKSVVVTGANGYLGSYICRQLLAKEYQVIAFRFEHYASVIIDDPDIHYVHVDITKEILPQEGVNKATENKEIVAVINAAALLGSSDYERNYAVNALGVENMIRFSKQAGVKRFIQISSVVVLKKVKGPYGETKLIGQQITEKSDMDYTVFIPAMILGPESLGLNRILKNVFRFPVFVPLVGSGRQTQHPIFVKDFARAIVASIDKPKTFRKTYTIAGDSVIPFRDLVGMILLLKSKRKIFVPVSPAMVSMMGRIFQALQKVPIFTAEHVKGVMQDSKLDVADLKADLEFEGTPLQDALDYSLKKIGNNWSGYLKPRDEIVLRKEED